MLKTVKSHKLLFFLAFALTAVALCVRVAPIVEGGDRLQRQCVSEDGYLMLTIARNLAMGHGFSVSDGLIPTNGTQPLCSLLYAACYVAVDSDRLLGLYPVVGVQIVISLAIATLIYVFTSRIFYTNGVAKIVSLIAAVLWFASPTSLMHSQNGLETGLSAFAVLIAIGLYDRDQRKLLNSMAWMSCLLLGVVLGVTFLARNDSCFLIAVMLIIHVLRSHQQGLWRRGLLQACVIGSVSVLVALPWLWFNVTKFGHLIPISGRAEALHVPFAGNFSQALVAMVENMLVVFRIPETIQHQPIVEIISGGLLVVLIASAWLKKRWLKENFSPGVLILAGFVTALFVYYSLFFGMPSFLSRYFFPATMLAVIAGPRIVYAIVKRFQTLTQPLFAIGVSVAVTLACVAFDVRIYTKGEQHQHFQVVDWVSDNVPESVWIGAVQTGTLGYYHDRTINLDGKVDPYALAARQQDMIPQYVIERNVEYITDWWSVATTWSKLPAYSVNYELAVADKELNLGVLRRRHTGAP